ncbi:MAG: hypothetical protein A2W00_04680 [Candidatus Eisenbacteria bacterium RBG_16_71_46]|nr:MAG: hypothetical protein A2W00_04680 [Candidatus Eisenbacteria bacterium RBG_16_71_46]
MALRIRERLGAGLKALSLPRGASSVYGSTGLTWTTLPGTTYDWKTQAGDLWDNSVVRINLKWKEDTFGEARLVVRRPDAEGKLQIVTPEHPLVTLLKHPNPWYRGRELMAGTNLSLDVDGNAYWLRLFAESGKLVGLHYLPHFQVEPVAGGPDGWLSHYWWYLGGYRVKLETWQVVHLRDGLDPRRPLTGLSRLGALLREVCESNEAATYSASLLKSGGLLRLLISPKQLAEDKRYTFSADQAKALKRLWRESDAAEPLVPTIPIEVSTPGYSPEQMALDKIRRIPTDFICAAQGVDPMAVGLPSDNKTYSNLSEALRATYENVMQRQAMIDEQITDVLMDQVLFSRPGDELGRDYSNVRALQEDMDKLYQRQTAAVGGPWLTPNEARAKVGLPEMPGGDALYPPRGSGGTPVDADRDGAIQEGKTETGGRGPGVGDASLARAREIIAAVWKKSMGRVGDGASGR